MSSPKRAYPDKLHLYNLMKTAKIKMYSGVYIRALYLLKETAKYYIGIGSWAFCCPQFKSKKENVDLTVDIPIVDDDKTIEFLNKEAWHDWVDRYPNDTDITESVSFLDTLYPDKKKIYFYELKSIISAYCNGSFIKYDKNGKEILQIEGLKYFTHKYNKLLLNNTPHLRELFDNYQNITDDDTSKLEAFKKYNNAEADYAFEHFNLTNELITISKNTIVIPYAFTKTTEWRENKVKAYDNAGEIYAIVTTDAIYFETNRHF